MKTNTVSSRASIARGWASSGLDQASYAAKHGISPRTLRSWIARYAPRQTPVERVRVIVQDALAKLQSVLGSLDLPDGTADDVPRGIRDADVGRGVPPGSGETGIEREVPSADATDGVDRAPPVECGRPTAAGPSVELDGTTDPRRVGTASARRSRGVEFFGS